MVAREVLSYILLKYQECRCLCRTTVVGLLQRSLATDPEAKHDEAVTAAFSAGLGYFYSLPKKDFLSWGMVFVGILVDAGDEALSKYPSTWMVYLVERSCKGNCCTQLEFLLACTVVGKEVTFEREEQLQKLTKKLQIILIFKI